MQVNYEKACKAFSELPESMQSSYLHPYFVVSDAKRDPALEPVFLVYKDCNEVFYYAFHKGIVPGTRFIDIQSPYPYGGPLCSTSDAGFLDAAWKQYQIWCQDHYVLAEFVRFHPIMANWQLHPGNSLYMRDTVWVDLEATDPVSSFSSRVRNGLHKARKHELRVVWEESEASYRAFAALYWQAMRERKADPFYYFSYALFQNFPVWDCCSLAFCVKNEEVLAASLFIIDSFTMEYYLAAATPEGKRCNASTLILSEAAVRGKTLGCQVLHLGGGTDNQLSNPLLFFKSGFSKNRAPFRIGKVIHNSEAYRFLQIEWQSRCGSCNDKLLFYRFPQ